MVDFLAEARRVTNLTSDGVSARKAEPRESEWVFSCERGEGSFRRIPWRWGLYNVPIPRWYRVAALWCRQFARTGLFTGAVDGTILMMQCVLFVDVTADPEHAAPGDPGLRALSYFVEFLGALVFAFEISVRAIAEGPRPLRFFVGPGAVENVFDLGVVLATLWILLSGSAAMMVVQMLRVLRIFRLVKTSLQFRMLLSTV